MNFLDAELLRERSRIPMWSLHKLHKLHKHRKSPEVLFPLPHQHPQPALAPLRDESVARCEGRLPPGFEDACGSA